MAISLGMHDVQAFLPSANATRNRRSWIRDSTPNLLQRQDAERSDEPLGQGIVLKPVHILQAPHRYQLQRTEAMDRRDSLGKMSRALTGRDCRKKPELSKRLPPLPPEKVAELDIAIIGAVGMHRNLRRKNSDVYITSIYEIDRAIEDKTEQPLNEELQNASPNNTMPGWMSSPRKRPTSFPPGAITTKIGLTGENALGPSPLYKMSAEELLAAKKYIQENLLKGFIVPSSIPFASLEGLINKGQWIMIFLADSVQLSVVNAKP